MSLKYQHKKTCLEEEGYTLLTTEEEFIETETFRFQCKNGHETEQKYTSLLNRISTLRRGKCPSLCGKCCTRIPILEKLLKRLNELGFELVRLDDDNLHVEYKCSCGEISNTNTKNIHKPTRQSTCNKCGNQVRKMEKEQKMMNAIVDTPSPLVTTTTTMNLPYGYQCITEGCTEYAYLEGTTEQPLYCGDHSSSKTWFIRYKSRYCIAPGCTKQSTYNYKEGQRRLFCKDHKQPKMINVNTVMCKVCNEKPARYNTKEEYPKALYCKLHRTAEMVDCCEKLCNPPECWRQGTFGFTRFDKKVVCKEHKLEGMKDVKNLTRSCEFTGCEKQANYNFPDTQRAVRCKEHKEMGMVDRYHDCCMEDGCCIRPIYNIPGQNKGIYCIQHKLHGMIDVLTKRCLHDGCDKVPFYNFRNFSFPIYCSSHYEFGMVDVKHIKCDECDSQACFGIVGNNANRCATHKSKGMMRNPNRRCRTLNCNEYAIYGNFETYPLFCELHKLDSHINLVESICCRCGLLYPVNDVGLCSICRTGDKKIVMKKQNDVKEWLDKNSFQYIIHDKPIDGGFCTKQRPDFVFDSINGVFSIVLEVDENAHHGYVEDCEKTRMINLSQALGQPTIFIRFNPDPYRCHGNKVYNTVPKERYRVLKHWLQKSLSMNVMEIKQIGFCSMIKLFYNDFNEYNCKYETLQPFDKE
jgi:hypothetical protein